MRRREFIAGLGGITVCPLAARAQQAVPMIGFFGTGSPEMRNSSISAAFHGGFAETGYVEGRNVAFEYRWADRRLDRLPALAAELVQCEVAVIAAFNTPTTLAAEAATKSIPIVFLTGTDLVASRV